MIDLGAEYQKWTKANQEIHKEVLANGYPSFHGGMMAGAPFDHFADILRGTRGISMDLRRQPKKLHEAMERWLNLSMASFKNFPMTNCPVVMMPLHKGDDTFMSDKQFDEFYWPYLRRLFLADGDALIIPQPKLRWIFSRIREELPQIQRVGLYGNAKSILRKTPEELQELRDLGLGIVYLGLESGDPEVLKEIHKGVGPERNGRSQVVPPGLRGLTGQAEDQIERQVGDPRFADLGHCERDPLRVMGPVHPRQCSRLE